MAWCGCSRKGPQCRASSGGGAAGWSVSTSTLYIPWRRRSSKALRPFSRGVSEWVFCAKNWQLSDVTPRLLRDWIADLRQDRAVATVRTYVAVLSAILTAAVDLEWLETN